jgi:rhodanese-related sulfurtransferase
MLLSAPAILIFAVSCNAGGSSDIMFTNTSADEAYTLIQNNKSNPDFVILDVRTPSEYASGHIENAVNLDYYADDFEEELNALDKDKAYLIYCRSGNRSAAVMKIMNNLGFTRVYNMQGGINAWINNGYPVVK